MSVMSLEIPVGIKERLNPTATTKARAFTVMDYATGAAGAVEAVEPPVTSDSV